MQIITEESLNPEETLHTQEQVSREAAVVAAESETGRASGPQPGRKILPLLIATVRLLLLRVGRVRGDGGMTTAEYAVGTVAACAFAAILYQVVTGGSVVAALGNLIQSALSALS